MTEPASQKDAPKQRRFLLWLIIPSALLIVAGISCCVLNRQRERADRVVGELLKEAQSRPSTRPVLVGKAVPGNAWEDYNAAMQKLNAFESRHNEIRKFFKREPGANQTTVEEILVMHPQHIESLQRGARKAEGQCPVVWEEGYRARRPEFGPAFLVMQLAVSKARLLRDQGKNVEAMQLMLDTAQFGRDMGSNTRLDLEAGGYTIIASAIEELAGQVGKDATLRVDLADLTRALELLDAHLPVTAQNLMNETLVFGKALKSPEVIDQGDLKWRFRILTRCGNALETAHKLHQRLADAQSKPYAETLCVAREVEAEVSASRNPVLEMAFPGSTLVGIRGGECRAQLRLVRTAAHFKATGEVLTLDDPFGDKLKHSQTGDTLKVWSLGPDGIDNGGTGDWKSKDGQDIVLTVERTP